MHGGISFKLPPNRTDKLASRSPEPAATCVSKVATGLFWDQY